MISAAPLDPIAAAVYLAVAAVVLVAVVRRPADALSALILTAPFDFSHSVGATTITFGKVALVASVFGLVWSRWPAGWVRGPNQLVTPAVRAIGLAVLAVLAATALSVAFAHDRGAALRETLKAFQYVLVFFVAAFAWWLDADRRRLRFVLIGVAIVVSVLALSQEVGGAPSGIWYGGRAFPRIAGPLEGPNQLAGYLGIVLPFLVAFALEAPSVAALAGCAVGCAALVLTLSRSGVVAGVVAVAVVLIVRRGVVWPVLVALGAGVAAAMGVLLTWHVSAVGERFISFGEVEQSGGVGTRSILWRAAYVLWRAHPIFGIGAGNFETSLAAVAPAGVRTHANSWYLQSLVEGGIPLLAATLGEAWASIVPFARFVSNDLCLAALAASAGFALHGIFDLLVFFPKVALTWFVVLGIAAVEARQPA